MDTHRHVLTRDGVPIDLLPRYVQILAHLVLRPGEVFSKNALLDEFWGDVAVTDNTVEQAIGAIRKAIDDDPSRPAFRLSVASWGDERLAAVDRTLSLVPGFAPARLVSAMVFVAHGNLADASDILERLLRKSPPGQMGWMIPIDPALVPLRRESCFERVLARLASRAS